jgi:hypothetical protein
MPLAQTWFRFIHIVGIVLFSTFSEPVLAKPKCVDQFRLDVPGELQLLERARQYGEPHTTAAIHHKALVNRFKRLLEAQKHDQLMHEYAAMFFYAQTLSVFMHHYLDSQKEGGRFYPHNFWQAFSYVRPADKADQQAKVAEVRRELAKVIEIYEELRELLAASDDDLLKRFEFQAGTIWQVLGSEELKDLREELKADILAQKIEVQHKPHVLKSWLGFLPFNEMWQHWRATVSQSKILWTVPNPSSFLLRVFLYNGIRKAEKETTVLVDASFPFGAKEVNKSDIAQEHYQLLKHYFPTRGFYFLVNYFRYIETQDFQSELLSYASEQNDHNFADFLKRAAELASFHFITTGAEDEYHGVSWTALALATGSTTAAAASFYAWFAFETTWTPL